MAKYNIYYGLSGGFGGQTLKETKEFDSQEEAEDYAHEYAKEEYDSYAGLHGLEDFDSIQEQYPEYSEEEVWDFYEECRESWLEYEAKEVIKYNVEVETSELCGYSEWIEVELEEEHDVNDTDFFASLDEVKDVGEDLSLEEYQSLVEDYEEAEQGTWSVVNVERITV